MASYGYRVGAYLIDFAFAVLVGFASGAMASLGGASDDSTSGVWVIATVVAWLINTVVIVGITRGRSIGKLVGGMRIVREDGRPARFGTGFLRDNLCRLIYLVPLASLADGLSPLGRKRQSLRDKMVGTRVVREPSYDSRAWVLALCAVAAIAVTIGAAELTLTDTQWNETSSTASAAVANAPVAADEPPATSEAPPLAAAPPAPRAKPKPQRVTAKSSNGKTYSCPTSAISDIEAADARVSDETPRLIGMEAALDKLDEKYPDGTAPAASAVRYNALLARYRTQLKRTNSLIHRYNGLLKSKCDNASSRGGGLRLGGRRGGRRR